MRYEDDEYVPMSDTQTDYHNWIFDTFDGVLWLQNEIGGQVEMSDYRPSEVVWCSCRDVFEEHPELNNPEFRLTEDEMIDVLYHMGF